MTTVRERQTWLGRAWASVALIPVFAFASFALGYALYDVLGYKPENADAPLWVAVGVGLVLLVVFLVPCAGAIAFGRRAGRPGRVPAALGALVGLALVVLTVVSTVGDALR
jgi:hypothetical protein